jgi:phospholipid-binding lipoprotein MlaA
MMYRSRPVGLRWLSGVAVVLALQGCATTPTGSAPSAADPIEPWNRNVFAFNEGLDKAVIKPVATGYSNVMPTMARTGVTNFFNNFKDAWSAVNSLLQGKVGDSMSSVMRVSTNTIFGIGGLMDWATELRIDRRNEDFGQTLGVWGFGAGPYIVWPLLGPSSVRDSFGLPLDIAATPGVWIEDTGAALGVSALNLVNVRANVLNATGLLDDIVLDKYTFVRDGYLQRRRNLVYDGNPPPLPEAAESSVPAVAR